MNLGVFGAALVLGISAIGSAIGIGIAGQASIGAWKKCYLSNKAAPFILTVFAGAPLTQTIYGFLLMQQMKSSSADPTFLLSLGIASSLAIAFSAVVQGKAGAAGADALSETGKGFSQYITVVGLCETVALFVLVFGRFENARPDDRPAPAPWRPVLAAICVIAGLAVMAPAGIVDDSGVHWVWPVLPVLGLAVFGVLRLPIARASRS